ncbi:lytic transglycosylase domain-containing protein [Brevundimonas sp.]|uniref:lytic transglycosylase domain-containing protein n=1 Tax=Brevundimonas sp. TaxID=1871086 RepID=UPI0025EF691B|nr:lytic transglycosylase domain-containing protein [Brevundimonas sp.]
MKAFSGPLGRLILVLASLLAFASTARAEPRPLSENDEAIYRAAFQDVRMGRFAEGINRARNASDPVLLGQLQFEVLFHRDYTATFEELSAWLAEYADHAQAPRAYALAMRRIPAGASEPRLPLSMAAARAYSVHTGVPESVLADRAARRSLNDGYLERAWELGGITGDWWVAGMAAYRLGRFEDAFTAFERVAIDASEDIWIRAGAGYWAARSLTEARRPQESTTWLRLAARWPNTFYGQVAMRQLGYEPLILNAPWIPTAENVVVIDAPPIDEIGAATFAGSDLRARRTAALAQLGRREEALAELRLGSLGAETSAARLNWATLGESLSYRLGLARATRIDATEYALPDLQPLGGFSTERALVYAICRKETRFNAEARSSAGAYGMMQVMPATASELTGDPLYRREPQALFDPAVNLRLGQNYIEYVMAMEPIQGDLLRAVVAYNGGPGPIYDARRALGPDADSLLMIENIPVAQSRQYVEDVVAAYWIYQRLMGGRLATLDAVVAGDAVIPLVLDRAPIAPTPAVVDAVESAAAAS